MVIGTIVRHLRFVKLFNVTAKKVLFSFGDGGID
jgi:hypothetical protein